MDACVLMSHFVAHSHAFNDKERQNADVFSIPINRLLLKCQIVRATTMIKMMMIKMKMTMVIIIVIDQNHPHRCPVPQILFILYIYRYLQNSRKCSSSGLRFNIKMSSYQYRKSHCGDKTVVRSSYLHSGISYTGKMTSLYWSSPLVLSDISTTSSIHMC